MVIKQIISFTDIRFLRFVSEYRKKSKEYKGADIEQNNSLVGTNELGFAKASMPVKVEISQEGLRALHGSKLNGSMNIDDVTNDIKYISEHQPIESFMNRFSQIVPNDYLQLKGSGTSISEEKDNSLLSSFRNICDEIVSGCTSKFIQN